VIDRLTEAVPIPNRVLRTQSRVVGSGLKKAMRRFGRQCRGKGKVVVKVVRQTESHLLTLGKPIAQWGQQAYAALQLDPEISPAQRERLERQLQSALEHHQRIEAQSRCLTQGKPLPHRKIVSTYDDTIAPIIKGKSNSRLSLAANPVSCQSRPWASFLPSIYRPAILMTPVMSSP